MTAKSQNARCVFHRGKLRHSKTAHGILKDVTPKNSVFLQDLWQSAYTTSAAQFNGSLNLPPACLLAFYTRTMSRALVPSNLVDMHEETVSLAPNLSIYLMWELRMLRLLAELPDKLETNPDDVHPTLVHDVEQFDQALQAVYTQIQHLYTLTGQLPIRGDHFFIRDLGYRKMNSIGTLCVEKRAFYPGLKPGELVAVFELTSEAVQEMEEYRQYDED